MSAITIRKIPDAAKQRLRLRAAMHGASMEAEARTILLAGLDAPISTDVSWIEQLIALGHEHGGVELPSVPDEPAPHARFDA
jgi:plasmid stability protein